mmetsp:Transcript_11947/g.32171  ORF Transcript_11947/g.32171 Transcript_11947/m.32171 type:complete len:93 (-) Transcript_11947:42-320(-)
MHGAVSRGKFAALEAKLCVMHIADTCTAKPMIACGVDGLVESMFRPKVKQPLGLLGLENRPAPSSCGSHLCGRLKATRTATPMVACFRISSK